MSFASISTTNPRSNPWNFHEIFSRIGGFENLSSFGHFIFFSFPWKSVKVSWIARLGQNFDQAKWDNTFCHRPNIIHPSVSLIPNLWILVILFNLQSSYLAERNRSKGVTLFPYWGLFRLLHHPLKVRYLLVWSQGRVFSSRIGILCLNFSLNPLRFSLTRETDTKMTIAKSWEICKTSILEF
jgi:hypothetical protein